MLSLCFFRVKNMKTKLLLQKLNNIDKSDAEFLIAENLNVKRSELFLIEDIEDKQAKKILRQAGKIKKGYPLSLVLGNAEFYGRKFFVHKRVLKPRLDTEVVCEQAIKLIKPKHRVLDLCCGSGVIGLTIALETGASVTLADISGTAIKLAKKNAKNLGVKANIIKSNLFNKLNQKFDVIVCNPPYIESNVISGLDKNVKKFDPRLALDGGADGLRFYRIIANECEKYLTDNGVIVFEIGYNQATKVKKLLEKSFDVTIKKDYNNKNRIVIGVKNGTTN